MAPQIKKIIKSEFKKANFKSFLFFLLFSSVIWLIVQFSQQYTEILEIPVKYENFPQDKLITEKESTLEIRVQQSGFQLAWFNLFTHKVKLDLSELPADSSYLKYNLLENHYDLVRNLPIDLNKAEFLEKEILIPFQMKSVKKVPVIPEIQIKYAPGFSSEKKLTLLTDSIQISGSQEVLDSVSEVHTKTVNFEDVDQDLLEEVGIKKPKKISLYQDKIHFRLEVEKFTERKMQIPIEVINAPPGININLYPAEVELSFKVSLAKYNLVEQLDFQIVCDYKDLIEDQEFFVPKIVEKPDYVQGLHISPRTVEYIIKK